MGRHNHPCLGSFILPGRATYGILQDKIGDLDREIQGLALLQAHDALCLLKNYISMPNFCTFLGHHRVSTTHYWTSSTTHSDVGTERRAERQIMGVSVSTGPYGRS